MKKRMAAVGMAVILTVSGSGLAGADTVNIETQNVGTETEADLQGADAGNVTDADVRQENAGDDISEDSTGDAMDNMGTASADNTDLTLQPSADIDNVSSDTESYADDSDTVTLSLEEARKYMLNADGDDSKELITGLDVSSFDTFSDGDESSLTVSFLGDSITSYQGYTQYSGNYYSESNMDVADTWWMKLLIDNQCQLGINESLGGSRVSWDGVTESTYYHLGSNYYFASDARVNQLGKNGDPDVIYVFGGMNDILSQDLSIIGTYDKASMVYGKTETFADAYFTLLTKLENTYPNAEIICLIPYDTAFSELIPDIATATEEVGDIIEAECTDFGLRYVDLRTAGIVYSEDLVAKDQIHPNESGMNKITACIENVMKNKSGLTKEKDGIYYYDQTGNRVRNVGKTIEGCLYYFGKDGKAVSNEMVTVDNKTYYFGSDCRAVKNEFFCDGTYTYYLQYDGSAMTDRLTYHPDGEHIIYFDSEGHEVFSDFTHVHKSISGDAVNDYCFFDVYGYMYVDVLTYDKTGTYLYYANPYGVLEIGSWFQFSDKVKWANGISCDGIARRYGYATENGTLMVNQVTYDWTNRICYMQGNGVARYTDIPDVQ